ncbi:MAG: imidazole glycerol phosphate synthase subunit HisH [Actinobacteria bacterium]|nr:imidazole glycerol phosphate synthase subunit HisH [Actinomycetota bacterium]
MIAILDYGSGNLRSAQRAFATTGHEVVVTADREICRKSAGLVVPGVGAFRSCMKGLLAVGGDEIVRERLNKQQSTFGICIGMQIFFESGTETAQEFPGATPGLGIWKGSVDKLNAPVLPHMGWNTVSAPQNSLLFKGLEEESFYFVHSYAAKTESHKKIAWAEYGDRFIAAIEDEAFFATQFHPEKSGAAGLALIKNWTDSL